MLMKGKSYNRGIRAHKLVMEALFRLMWDAFVAWYAGHTREEEECVIDEDAIIRKSEQCRNAIAAKAEVRARVDELEDEAKELLLLFQDFTHESRTKSKMLTFWRESSSETQGQLVGAK